MTCVDICIVVTCGMFCLFFPSPQFRACEENQYHVCDMVIETRDKPFTVMVDSDTDLLLENVVR